MDKQKDKKEYLRLYHLKNKEKAIKRTKQWRIDNREKWLITRRKREQSQAFKSKPNYIYTVIKRNSLRKNREFVLTKDEFINWYTNSKKICEYCGINEDFIQPYGYTRLEIDRTNNDKGYSLDNIVLACTICNKIKSNILDYDEMKYIGKNLIIKKWLKLK